MNHQHHDHIIVSWYHRVIVSSYHRIIMITRIVRRRTWLQLPGARRCVVRVGPVSN